MLEERQYAEVLERVLVARPVQQYYYAVALAVAKGVAKIWPLYLLAKLE